LIVIPILSHTSVFLFRASNQQDVFSILWILVFGFATLNILGIASRQHEPSKRRMNFGELLAVLTVLVAVALLGWEILGMMHIFPLKIQL
jgi:hypothetical protein